MTSTERPASSVSTGADDAAAIRDFRKPCNRRAWLQVLTSFVPYFACWYAMYLCSTVTWWLPLMLVIPAAGFLVRIFIILHDCGHGSFFTSRRANDVTGFIAGVLTFVPYQRWRAEHARHHATSGNLDRRGIGDIWTLTVSEYVQSSWLRRVAYRIARNPLVLFLVAPLCVFGVQQRFNFRGASVRDRTSVYATNLGLVIVAAACSRVFGIADYLLVQLAVIAVSGAAGIWLFYVQHQFEAAYWHRDGDWDYTDAALRGSSYYKLPAVLQWFSGNIGFHHIHHLHPGIPNYHLERCHRSDPRFSAVPTLTLLGSWRTLRLRLWDEVRRQLTGYPAG